MTWPRAWTRLSLWRASGRPSLWTSTMTGTASTGLTSHWTTYRYERNPSHIRLYSPGVYAGLTVVVLVCWVLCLDWSPVFFSQVVTLSVSSLLQRLCLNGSTGQEVVVKKDLQNVEALTFDPVSRLLYWVDAGAQKIEVQRSHMCWCFYSWLTLKKMKRTGTQDQERFWLIIKSWTQTDYSM